MEQKPLSHAVIESGYLGSALEILLRPLRLPDGNRARRKVNQQNTTPDVMRHASEPPRP